MMVIIEKIELNTGAVVPCANGLCGAFELPNADRPDADRADTSHRTGIITRAPGVNPALARR